MGDTVYRFLPWSRRGLAAAIPDETTATPTLAQRVTLPIVVDIANAGQARPTVVLNGPGDVIGVDPSQIIRVSPRNHTTNAEPNYLAAVDFDAPELPWLFTPRGRPGNDQLQPWLVLVVVEDRAGVSIQLPAVAPLPQLRIEGGASGELPNLADSWAWAHVQLVEPTAGAQDVSAALGAQPDRNASRLVCPRRLKPNARWIACVVPAFDVGVVRGLGGTPAADAAVGPAWTSPDSITLPVYFHWEFQTGVEGDFESLAQRLKPVIADSSVGYVDMHVGEGAPPLVVPAGQVRIMPMDGALRATTGGDGTLAEVPNALSEGLALVSRTLADAADGVIDGQELVQDDRQPVGPPVYGSAWNRKWKVEDGDPLWSRELNLDPRPRVAAGLAAECVRENQEDIVSAAWRQVGDVLAAEAALQRAALSEMVAGAFHRRHLVPMADARTVAFAAPVAARTPVDGVSMTASVARTSLPDAVLDAGLRRALSPSGRAVQLGARRIGVKAGAFRSRLVAELADGLVDVDPTRFARPALSGAAAAEFDGKRNLAGIGLAKVGVAASMMQRLTTSAQALEEAPAVAPEGQLALRDSLRASGILGTAHIEAIRELSLTTVENIAVSRGGDVDMDATTMATTASGSLLDSAFATLFASASASAAAGVGLVLEGPAVTAGGRLTGDAAASVTVGVLDVDRGGLLVVRNPAGQPNTPVAELSPNLAGRDLGAILTRLPNSVIGRRPEAGASARTRGALPVISAGEPGAAGMRSHGVSRDSTRAGAGAVPSPVVHTPVADASRANVSRATVVVPPLIIDAEVIGRFESAVRAHSSVTVVTTAAPVATLVPYALASTAATVKQRLDPAVAQPLRRDALVSFGGASAGALAGTRRPDRSGWWTTPRVDRVMAYPSFDVPAYHYLAAYDRDRFCPGVDLIPTDSITMLETNPRFIGAFMAGLNHETNRELLWRGYPTDSRGTPFRKFWGRFDGSDDITPIHTWKNGSLAAQTADPKGKLVLIVRGELLRRYPNTVVVAFKALTTRTFDRGEVKPAIFGGQFDPDVSFFGFDLIDDDLHAGSGWFFGLMEPVTEPRFGLDETAGSGTGPDALSWADTGVLPGGHIGRERFGALQLNPTVACADSVAVALFQKPFALYVNGVHLVPADS